METPKTLAEKNLISDFNNYKLVHNFIHNEPLKSWLNETNFNDIFKKDWNSLMEVVEKIEKSTVNRCINGITTMIGLSLDHTFYCYIAINKVHLECKGVDKLDATYKTVLKFIEWYNKQ